MAGKEPQERAIPSIPDLAQSVQIGTITFSTERDQIVPAMLAVQKALTTIPYDSEAVIEHKGGGGHSFKYTSLSGILEALLPVLHKNELLLVQGGGGSNALGVTTCAMHVSGQWAQNTIPISTNGAAMAVGSGVSFGRRYGILPLFGLSCEDDGGLAAQRSMEPEQEKFTADMVVALPESFQIPIKILGWNVGKCKTMLVKFVDDTGSLDRATALAYLNREVDKLADGGSR